jgi:biopolymer transport protein ExbB/TolQ
MNELANFSLLTFFQRGGVFMYPILFVLVASVAIAIERFIFLTKSNRDNKNLWSKLMPLINQGDLKAAEEVVGNNDSAIGKIFAQGIGRARTTTNRLEVELAMEESLMEVTPMLERRTHYLATFANVATLLGLLGTIIGLIEGFSAVSGVNAGQKADQLSSAVSVAMNCTAFGLMTAIPTLVIHAWLQSRTNDLIDSLEMASVKFLNALNLKS